VARDDAVLRSRIVLCAARWDAGNVDSDIAGLTFCHPPGSCPRLIDTDATPVILGSLRAAGIAGNPWDALRAISDGARTHQFSSSKLQEGCMASSLPDYVAAAKPMPMEGRAAWFRNTAPTYAGIMLWFVFWRDIPRGQGLGGADEFSQFAGGMLAQGLGVAFLGLILAALVCHFLFYLVPGLLGFKSGLPLYIVGTSTYGVRGGFVMPGFLMGALQFGWLGVNAFGAASLLCAGQKAGDAGFTAVAVAWALVAAFLGLKGIKYVASVASLFPLIPLVILIIMVVSTASGLSKFDAASVVKQGSGTITLKKSDEAIKAEADKARVKVEEISKTRDVHSDRELPSSKIVLLMMTIIVGFFATAGAAGADFGMNARSKADVHLGGLVGIAGSTIFAGGMALLFVAGAYGLGKVGDQPFMQATSLIVPVLGSKTGVVFNYLLAIAAFPSACFSSFIAANSFKTTLPKVNPFITCGIGTAVSIALAVTGWAGDVVSVFLVIGASFGPICGAMAADYLIAGCKWAGPRAGFNPAGWISWIVGFIVGAADFLPRLGKMIGCEPIATFLDACGGIVPCPPLSAFVVGFVLYYILARIGLTTRVLETAKA
jgi:cytosine permease